jgi:hypothetical protein
MSCSVVLVEIMHVLLIASKLFFDGEELKTLIFLQFCLDKFPFFLQFVHGKENLRQTRFPGKNKSEVSSRTRLFSCQLFDTDTGLLKPPVFFCFSLSRHRCASLHLAQDHAHPARSPVVFIRSWHHQLSQKQPHHQN